MNSGVPDKSGVKTIQGETITVNEIIEYLQPQKRLTNCLKTSCP